MILTSALFLVFLAILIFLYYIIPKKLQWVLLLTASIFFIVCATNDIKLYLCIVYVVYVSFFGAILLDKVKKEKNRRIIEIIFIILVTLQLGLLKYLDFFAQTIESITKLNTNVSSFKIIAPIGVSFYTLIAIGYIIDVYRKKVEANKNFFKHTLFILFFPQLTSGPITRYPEMKEELFKAHNFNFNNIKFGSQRILWGIFKKLVISERLALIANTVFNNYTEYSGLNIIIGAIAFLIQLYTDFSGCMDIVIGTAETLEIKLPENFDTPFFSRTVPEFWRRWHMTLNDWFKDYLYIPLGGSRKGVFRTYINIMIIFLISGLWHGAAWTYVIWGLLNGIYSWGYRLLDTSLKPFSDKLKKMLKINEERKLYKVFQMTVNFALICFAFIFFRAETVSQAIVMIKSIISKNFFAISDHLGVDGCDYIIIFIGIAVLLIVSILKQKNNVRQIISNQHIIVSYGIWITLIVCILVLGHYGIGYDASNFLYQKF